MPLLGRQLISACSGLWQWLQKMVMVPALGCLKLAAHCCLLCLWLRLNLLTPLLPASFCTLLGRRGQAAHGESYL